MPYVKYLNRTCEKYKILAALKGPYTLYTVYHCKRSTLKICIYPFLISERQMMMMIILCIIIIIKWWHFKDLSVSSLISVWIWLCKYELFNANKLLLAIWEVTSVCHKEKGQCTSSFEKAELRILTIPLLIIFGEIFASF